MNNLSNADKYLKLRAEFPFFTYESYTWNITENGFFAEFHFNLADKYEFRPTLSFPARKFYQWEKLDKTLLDNLVFHIGMIELISYWKAACSKKIIIKPHQLDKEQILFWKKIYFHGLGEFFYLNNIDVSMTDFVDIQASEGSLLKKTDIMTTDSVIIPIGGGKDSVVTLELLRNLNEENLPLIMNPRGASLETAGIGGFPREQIIEINRSIHPQLLELNKSGFLNGHTPFSALLAFVCLLSAAATGKRNIALSNESSANESTVENSSVNHQYSKSYEFEADFRNYTATYISERFNYFSFLRPLSELQIASLFARYNKYFSSFKSCNAGSKTDIWCCNCPKCLFAFIILSPFIERKTIISIFGQDLLDDGNMKYYLEQLCGIETVKPFECVGTVDEVNIAVNMLMKKMPDDDLPLLLRYYKTTAKCHYYQQLDFNFPLSHFNDEHFLETDFVTILKQYF
jgi:UDP-N-acetyl-alpha-D-muramoyl-L-alanyl-L-glutamate epimerase